MVQLPGDLSGVFDTATGMRRSNMGQRDTLPQCFRGSVDRL